MRFLFLEVSQYLFNNERVFDTGNNFHASAATLTGFNVNIEDPFQPLHPGHRLMAFLRGFLQPILFWRCRMRLPFTTLGWRHFNSVLAVWREDTVESGKIDARLGYQRGELCDKVQGLKDDVGRTITVWCFELVTYFAVEQERLDEVAYELVA